PLHRDPQPGPGGQPGGTERTLQVVRRRGEQGDREAGKRDGGAAGPPDQPGGEGSRVQEAGRAAGGGGPGGGGGGEGGPAGVAGGAPADRGGGPDRPADAGEAGQRGEVTMRRAAVTVVVCGVL